MSQNQLYMQRAKQYLSGLWGTAAVATLIYMLLIGACSMTYVGEYILYGPLMVGYCLFLMHLVSARLGDYNLLFKGFNNFGNTLVAGLLVSLAISVGMILLIVPGIIVALGLSMTFFIMVDNPGMSGIDAMQESWRLMQGHKWDLFCLYFRFIGWYLLVILTCGILALWVTPYVTVAQLNFYRQIRYGSF